MASANSAALATKRPDTTSRNSSHFIQLDATAQLARPASAASAVAAEHPDLLAQRTADDMKKIKTKLVTFVTDNVRLVGIVGDKAPQADRLESASVLRDVSGLKAFHNEADT
jgi:hypothetical protein